MWLFLSTPSARRATQLWGKRWCCLGISIHALREEGDAMERLYAQCPENFYPRPPRGGRPRPASGSCCGRYFYPRPPRGGRLE